MKISKQELDLQGLIGLDAVTVMKAAEERGKRLFVCVCLLAAASNTHEEAVKSDSC